MKFLQKKKLQFNSLMYVVEQKVLISFASFA
jgi:hypothetical protein